MEYDPKHPGAQCTIMSTNENSRSSISVWQKPYQSAGLMIQSACKVGYQKEKSGYLQCGGWYHINLEEKIICNAARPSPQRARYSANDIPELKERCITVRA